MERVKVLGILGGIGCGKSTIGDAFADLGALVLDADRSAHAALEDREIRDAIATRFPGVVDSDDSGSSGAIDRRALASIVFDDPGALAALEAIVHPFVKRDLRERLDAALADPTLPLVILDAPLLLETGLDAWCDDLVFVDVPFPVRARRVQETRSWDESELRRRESRQLPLAEKRARAGEIIDNSGDRAAAKRQVAEIFRRFARAVRPDDRNCEARPR